MDVNVAPLPAGVAAQTTGNQITLSADAAGWGWYVDPNPTANTDFLPTSTTNEFQAVPGSAADGKLDLLTVLIHELGHVLGLSDNSVAADNMDGVLTPGLRRLPGEGDIANLQALGVIGGGAQPATGAVSGVTTQTLVIPNPQASASSTAASTASQAPQYQVVVGPNLTNGNFAAGVSGWTTYGDVNTNANVVTLRNTGAADAQLNQAFQVSSAYRYLKFTVTNNALAPNPGTGPNDAFEVALDNASTGAALAGTDGLANSDALLNIQADGSTHMASSVTKVANGDGSTTYYVNLQSALAGSGQGGVSVTPAALSFDLIGFGNSQSQISLRDVQLVQNLVALDQTASTQEDASVTLNPVAADPTGPGATPVASIVQAPAHGRLVPNADGSYTYVPNTHFFGTDSFQYSYTVGGQTSNAATVQLTVQEVAYPPTEANSSATVTGGLAYNFDPLSGATDINGHPLQAVLDTAPAHGSLVQNANGTWTYTPNTLYAGPDAVVFHLADGQANSAPITVSFAVKPAHHAPVAQSAALQVLQDGSVHIDLASYGTDPDGNAISAQVVAQPTHGNLVQNPDGSYTYTPAAGYYGADSLSFTVADAYLSSQTAVLSLDVTPVLANSSATLAEGASVVFNPLATQNPGAPLTASIVAQPAHGSISVNANGTWTYTPAVPFFGADSFSYQVNDGTDNSNVATVSLTVNHVAPTLINTSSSLDEDSSQALNLAANATAVPGYPLSAQILNAPAHGMLTQAANGTWLYTPNQYFYGADSFTYTVSDGVASSNTATVTLNVNKVEIAPTLADSAVSLNELGSATLNPLTAATDVNGDALTASIVSQPAHGKLTVNADGTWTYTPTGYFYGTDTFTYTVSDGVKNSNTATVTLNVNKVEIAPTLADSAVSLNELGSATLNPLTAATDVNGDALTASIVSQPAHGKLTVNTDGTWTYTPTGYFYGTDTFTYTVSDGVKNSNTAMVTLNVKPIALPPIATGSTVTGAENSVVVLTWANFGVSQINNISNGPLAIVIQALPADGSLQAQDANGNWVAVAVGSSVSQASIAAGKLRFVPASNASGGPAYGVAGVGNMHNTYAQFSFVATDGVLSSASAQMSVNITPVAQDPLLGLGAGTLGRQDYMANWEDVATQATVTPTQLMGPKLDGWTTSYRGLDQTGTFMVWRSGNQMMSADGHQYLVNAANGDGNQWLQLGGMAGIDHVITTQAGASYTLSFDLAEQLGYTGGVSIYIDGVKVADLANTSNATALNWQKQSFSFTGAGGVQTVSIVSDYDASTVGVGASPIPLQKAPASIGAAFVDQVDLQGPQPANLGLQGSVVALQGVSAALQDTDGSESLRLTVTGLPTGMLLGDGTHTATSTGVATALDLTGWNLNALTLTSQPNYYGTVHLLVTGTASESVGGSSASTSVELAVHVVPTLASSIASVKEAGSVVFNPLTTAQPSQPLTAAVVIQPAHGHISQNADGTWTYTPNVPYYGVDSFSYVVNDGGQNSNVATVRLIVQHTSPTLANTSVTLNENASQTLNLLGNAQVAAGYHAQSVQVLIPPTHGSLSKNADGSYTYTPSANYYGADKFMYVVNDGVTNSNIATESITVQQVTVPPTALGGTVTGTENTALVLAWANLGVASATGNNSPLSIVVQGLPADGSLQAQDANGSWKAVAVGATISQADIAAGKLRFVPASNASGGPAYGVAGVGNMHNTYAQFSFVATDGVLTSAVAQVNVNITPVALAPSLSLGASSSTQHVLGTGWEDVKPTSPTKPTTVAGPVDGWTVLGRDADWDLDSANATVWSTGDQMADMAGRLHTVTAAAGDGSNWLQLGGAVNKPTDVVAQGISRQITTVGGAHYTLSFDLAAQLGSTANPGGLSVYIDGHKVADFSASSNTQSLNWQHQSVSFVGQGGVQTVTLVADSDESAEAHSPFIPFFPFFGPFGFGAQPVNDNDDPSVMLDGISLDSSQALNQGLQGSRIALQGIAAALADTDGSETLQLSLLGLPAGTVLSDGSHSATVGANQSAVDISGWNTQTLAMTPPASYFGTLTLQVQATATELAYGSSASSKQTLNVVVNPLAQVPSLTLTPPDARVSQTLFATTWAGAAGIVWAGHGSVVPMVYPGTLLDGWNIATSVAGKAPGFPLWLAGEQMTNALGQKIAVQGPAGSASTDAWLGLSNGVGSSNQSAGLQRTVNTVAGATYTLNLNFAGALGQTAANSAIGIYVDGKLVNSYSSASSNTALIWQNVSTTLQGDGNAHTVSIKLLGGSSTVAAGALLQGVKMVQTLPDTATTVYGAPGKAIKLPALATQLAAGDPGKLAVTIQGLPSGATLSDGTHSALVRASTTVLDVSGWNLNQLTLVLPPDTDSLLDGWLDFLQSLNGLGFSEQAFQVTVTATNTEAQGGSRASISKSFSVQPLDAQKVCATPVGVNPYVSYTNNAATTHTDPYGTGQWLTSSTLTTNQPGSCTIQIGSSTNAQSDDGIGLEGWLERLEEIISANQNLDLW